MLFYNKYIINQFLFIDPEELIWSNIISNFLILMKNHAKNKMTCVKLIYFLISTYDYIVEYTYYPMNWGFPYDISKYITDEYGNYYIHT